MCLELNPYSGVVGYTINPAIDVRVHFLQVAVALKKAGCWTFRGKCEYYTLSYVTIYNGAIDVAAWEDRSAGIAYLWTELQALDRGHKV